MRSIQHKLICKKRRKRMAAVSVLLGAALLLNLMVACVPAKVFAAGNNAEPGKEEEQETEEKSGEVSSGEADTDTELPEEEEKKDTPTEEEKATEEEKEASPETEKAEIKEEKKTSSETDHQDSGSADTTVEASGTDAGSTETSDEAAELSAVEVAVPIYNYDIVNIVAPAKYAVALNPYGLAIRTGVDEVSTEQIVSRNYGIINKSSTDKIVTVTFTVEDLNGGKIVFVDSPEEAQNAAEDVYAIYLAAVPADDSGIQIGGEHVNTETSAADLSDVDMNGAADMALPLREGESRLSFKLARAVYCYEDGSGIALEDGSDYEEGLRLAGLAPGEEGATAFTFVGAMNPKADWEKLVNGVRISAVYTYETATGDEEIIQGTGAMIEAN